MAEKELLKKQKEDLERDIEIFSQEVTAKIAHTTLQNDEFDSLFVFGNFYKLATETSPQLQQAWEEYDSNYKTRAKEINQLNDEVRKLTQDILKSYDIRIEKSEERRGKDSVLITTKIYVDDTLILDDMNYDIIPSTETYLRKFLERKEQVPVDVLNKYLSLKQKLEESKGVFGKIKSKIIESQIKSLAEENYKLKSYMKVEPFYEKIKDAHSQILANKPLLSKIQDLKHTDKIESSDLKKALSEKATTVLALKYLTVYNKNFEYLRMHPQGAKLALEEMLTKNAEYYSQSSIQKVSKNIDEWIKVGKVASALHEQWREGRKKEDGSFEPRWKKVKDSSFIKSVQKMKELPPTIRIVDGFVEQDIANTEFNDLCFDYQIENFEAAQVAIEVSKENYTKAEAGIAGKKIHDEWLKRNPWAKDGDLDVEFIDLIHSEKVKDLIHYEIAKEVHDEKENYNDLV